MQIRNILLHINLRLCIFHFIQRFLLKVIWFFSFFGVSNSEEHGKPNYRQCQNYPKFHLYFLISLLLVYLLLNFRFPRIKHSLSWLFSLSFMRSVTCWTGCQISNFGGIRLRKNIVRRMFARLPLAKNPFDKCHVNSKTKQRYGNLTL